MAEVADITGRRALVTGATSGIGAAVADALERAGAHVLRHGLDGELDHDLTRPGSGAALAAAAGAVDLLVHSASIQERAAWSEISDASAERQIRANLIEPLALLRQALQPMVESGFGRVVVIGSVQHRAPHPHMLAYAASKAGLEAVVRGLAREVAAAEVTINTVAPGVIETPRNQDALADPDYRDRVLRGIPVGRIGAAQDCVGAVMFLCSDAGSYITGQELVIDGGMLLA